MEHFGLEGRDVLRLGQEMGMVDDTAGRIQVKGVAQNPTNQKK